MHAIDTDRAITPTRVALRQQRFAKDDGRQQDDADGPRSIRQIDQQAQQDAVDYRGADHPFAAIPLVGHQYRQIPQNDKKVFGNDLVFIAPKRGVQADDEQINPPGRWRQIVAEESVGNQKRCDEQRDHRQLERQQIQAERPIERGQGQRKNRRIRLRTDDRVQAVEDIAGFSVGPMLRNVFGVRQILGEIVAPIVAGTDGQHEKNGNAHDGGQPEP